jgi:hypothetical protein
VGIGRGRVWLSLVHGPLPVLDHQHVFTNDSLICKRSGPSKMAILNDIPPQIHAGYPTNVQLAPPHATQSNDQAIKQSPSLPPGAPILRAFSLWAHISAYRTCSFLPKIPFLCLFSSDLKMDSSSALACLCGVGRGSRGGVERKDEQGGEGKTRKEKTRISLHEKRETRRRLTCQNRTRSN